jgi:hypothetical protein
MGKPMQQLNKFRVFLKTLPVGRILGENEIKVKKFLFDCWSDLEGSDDTSMSVMKLHRIENLAYNPPNKIEFDIERHGGTVMGSVYAEVYHWTIDLDQGQVHHDYPKKRVVGTRDEVLKVGPIAEKIVQEILGFDKDSQNIEWKSDKKVRVLISEIIPETNQQTTTARRKRFRNCVEELLLPNGWQTTKQYNVYEKCE